MIAREQGEEKATGASENVIYKIEVPANRLVSSKNPPLPIFLIHPISC